MSQLTVTNTAGNGFQPVNLDEAMRLSEMLAKSQMVPTAYRNKPEDVFVAMAWGKEIGLAPLQALQNIAVISGKPSVYGDAAMALVQASPVCEDIEEYFEGEGTTNPVAVCVAKRKGRKAVVAKFSVEDAKRAGLWGKQGPWQAYPKRMMQMRARGFALRDAFPDVLKGLITAEEAQDYPSELNQPKPAKDITPRNPLDMVAAPAPALPEPEPMPEPEVLEAYEPEAEPVTEPEPEVVAEADPVLEQANELAQEAVQELAELEPTVVAVGYGLMVPGKDLPFSVHQSLDEWADAYEDLAEKTAKAGKVEPRQRMTKLKELKEANQGTLDRIDTVKRLRHTANYQRRIRALGASQ